MAETYGSRAGWYLRRGLSMSPGEVVYRLGQASRTLWERSQWMAGSRGPVGAGRENDLPRPFRASGGAAWGLDQASISQFEAAFPGARNRILESADDVMGGRYRVFGRDMTLGTPPAWTSDPLSGRPWPDAFWADVDVRDGPPNGGALWVWELNRHHHLSLVANAYVLSGDERYRQFIIHQIQNWIGANPRWTGVNWASPLEIAVRLINWSWALSVLEESGFSYPSAWRYVLASTRDQAMHISRHLSRFSSGNNHLMGEAAGLAVVGQAFPRLAQAGHWARLGRKTLLEEFAKQIHPDGVPAEQAVDYLAFILELNLVAWTAQGEGGRQYSDIWLRRLDAANDFIAHIRDNSGNVPRIGDSAEASVFGFHSVAGADRFRPVLAAAASILEKPALKRSAGGWDGFAHWILGEDGKIRFDAVPPAESEPGSKAFGDGGYCVMRTPGRLIVFDCGPLGYLSTAAHGHADALSLWIHVDGQAALIDSGTFAYQEGGAWRVYFRGTSAHNTVVVDQKDQSEQLGTFLWGRKADARLLKWDSSREYDLAVAEHDGYRRFGVVHRRSVLFVKPDALLVVDDLLGEGRRHVQQLWHFSPEAVIEHDVDSLMVRIGPTTMRLETRGPSGLERTVVSGCHDPIQGWTSGTYGERQPAPVADFHMTSGIPLRLVSMFAFGNEVMGGGASMESLVARYGQLVGEGVNR